jgi:hypothetical protein
MEPDLILRIASIDKPGLTRKLVSGGNLDVLSIESDAAFADTDNVYPELIQCGYEPKEASGAALKAYRAAVFDTRCTCLALSLVIQSSADKEAKSRLLKMADMTGPEMLKMAMAEAASETSGRGRKR